jgi:hypothetical protein
MRLKTLLAAAAVIGFVFGIALLLFPFQTTAAYGYRLIAELAYVPRYVGATLLGTAVINWIARNATTEGRAIRAIVVGNLVGAVCGLGVALANALNLPGNGLVWLNVVIYAGLLVGFGYFMTAHREVTAPTTRVPPGAPIAH